MDGELAKCGESIFLPWHLFNHGTESEASRNLLPSRVNRELRSNGQTCKGAAEPLVVELLGSAELVGCALTTSHRVVRLFFWWAAQCAVFSLGGLAGGGKRHCFRASLLQVTVSPPTVHPYESLPKMHHYRNCDEQNEYRKQQVSPFAFALLRAIEVGSSLRLDDAGSARRAFTP